MKRILAIVASRLACELARQKLNGKTAEAGKRPKLAPLAVILEREGGGASAAVYSAVSLALGYVGWSSKARAQQQEPTTSATEGQSKPPVGAGEQSQLVEH